MPHSDRTACAVQAAGDSFVVIGVPREIKQDEYRVGMIPVGVEELTRAGHTVLVESGAGLAVCERNTGAWPEGNCGSICQ